MRGQIDDGTAYAEKSQALASSLEAYISEHTEPLQVRSLDLTQKPVAVIYNPTSGKKYNIRAQIETTLAENGGIACTFYETERYMHAWELAGGLIDFSQHSALVAVGGDGTLHEVINGMLQRSDGAKLPIGLIPNGSGNDLIGCLGIKSVEQALSWLIKSDVVKMDVNKVLIDCEHEDEIMETDKASRALKFRYSVINAAVGYIAKCTHKADTHKPYMGRHCYVSAALANFFTTRVDDFGLFFEQYDGSKIELPLV